MLVLFETAANKLWIDATNELFVVKIITQQQMAQSLIANEKMLI